ncbi:FUSC family protein [Rossellomorea sp. RS05]|uniref:FUSC family protein n=1 Tax=Rossellomorea sp. RS05 TaxID=3149166 RepID=UPI0032217AD4
MRQLHRQHIWLGRFLASDPGRKRLEQAGKATLSLMTAVFITLILLKMNQHPSITPAIISGMMGMFGIVIVLDGTKNKKKVTLLWIAVSVATGVTLGSLLSPYPYAVNVLLVAAMFSAFYFTRYAIRYFSIGMASFMSIYFSSVLKLDVSQLAWFYIGIAIGATSAYFYQFLLFKSSSQVLKRSLISFHIQSNVTFTILLKAMEDPASNEKRRKKLDRNVRKLNEYARTLSVDMNEGDLKDLWPGMEVSELRLYVFDAAMLIQTLSDSLKKLKELNVFEQDEIREVLIRVIRSLRDADVLAENYEPKTLEETEKALQQLRLMLMKVMTEEKDPPRWIYLLRRIESISNHVLRAALSLQQALKGKKESVPREEIECEKEEKKDKPELKGLKSSTRKGIQALFAGGLAILAGELIAPAQPYWVLLTTFIVQMGTETVGRTYLKAFQRSIGTVIGALLGFGLANLVSGVRPLEVVLLFMALFFSYYLFSVSYTMMSLFITMLIAFMYDILLGGISFGLMGARVLDTIIGAFIALLVSALIFPKKTKSKVTDTFDDFFDELSEYVESYLDSFLKEKKKPLTVRAFDLDQKVQTIKDEAQSILQRPGAMTKTDLGRWLTVVTAINYYAKHLLASSHRRNEPFPEELQKGIVTIGDKLTQNIESVRSMMKDPSVHHDLWSLADERRDIETQAPDRLKSHIDVIHHVYYVWKINQSIVALGEELGGSIRDKDKGSDIA